MFNPYVPPVKVPRKPNAAVVLLGALIAAVRALWNLCAFVRSVSNGPESAPAEAAMRISWRDDPDEWYVRSDAVMSPAFCIDAERQHYHFTIWVNSAKLANA